MARIERQDAEVGFSRLGDIAHGEIMIAKIVQEGGRMRIKTQRLGVVCFRLLISLLRVQHHAEHPQRVRIAGISP